jgi:hypothetical protein
MAATTTTTTLTSSARSNHHVSLTFPQKVSIYYDVIYDVYSKVYCAKQ